MMRRFVLSFLIFSFVCFSVYSEENIYSPEPYEEEEFAQWMLDLRRAEIVLVGSLPLTLFFTDLGYQLIRFAAHNFEEGYAPMLAGNPVGIPLEETEKLGVLIASLSISAVISIVDFIIGEVQEKNEKPNR